MELDAFAPQELARVWDKVNVKPGRDDEPDWDACWPWEGGTDQYGFGRIRMSAEINGAIKVFHARAHRVIGYLMQVENAEEGHWINLCGNKACCNPGPKHWGIATVKHIKKRKRRRPGGGKGAANSQARLTATKVAAIRQMLALPAEKRPTHKAIATLCGVRPTTISAIATGANWKEATA